MKPRRTESYRDCGEDRVAVINDGGRTIIIAAAGAGGVGNGGLATETGCVGRLLKTV